ncbi:MAG: NADH-quinone oxidoreductase subunit H [Candidatus Odinarchaeota archaeon]
MADIITFITDLLIALVDDLLAIDLSEFRAIIIMLLTSLIWFIFVLLSVVMLIWLERKAMGRFMDRRSTKTGPVPYGLFQNFADFFKLLGKEIIFPNGSDRLGMIVGLFIIVTTGVAAYFVIPFTEHLFVSDPPMGFLVVFAIFSLYPVAVAIIGWTSNNKFTLLGGFRSAAQLVSYEIPLVLSLAGAVLIVNAAKDTAERSFSLISIVTFQSENALGFLPFAWFTVLLPIGALIFTITTVAEAERVPFDLPEGESELIMGWRTELTAIFYMIGMLGEYLHMYMGAALSVMIFFGGWTMPFPEITGIIPGSIWFTIKVYLILFLEIWIRGALPRIRIDQLLDFSWKFLVPMSIVNLLLAAVIAIGAGDGLDPLWLTVGYILTLVVLAVVIIRYVFMGKPKEIPETYTTADHKKKPKKSTDGVKA